MVPCPNCGCTCEIATDAFDGDLSSFATTGTPTIASGKLVLNAGDGVIHNLTAVSADTGVHVEIDPLTSDATAKLRLKAAWTDANNFLFGELAIASSAGTIRLGQKSGGTESWLTLPKVVEDTGAELNARSTLMLCWAPGMTQTPQASFRGPLFPSGASQSGSGETWNDLGQLSAVDGNTASVELSLDFPTSKVVLASGFNSSIPDGSTIDGIEAQLFAARNGGPGDGVTVTLTTLRLVDGGGSAVGDNKATGQVLQPGGVLSAISAGGATDDWNAGLTWEDFASTQAGLIFQITYDDGGTELEGVVVDYVSITVYYTTPSRRSGRLTIAYGNTGSVTVDCITDYNVRTDDGLKAGVESDTGDWDIDTFTLSYLESESRPTCPGCECTAGEGEPCGCCDDPPSDAYVIDMGATLSDDECECSAIPQTFEVTNIIECGWSYSQEIGCELDGDDGTAQFEAFAELVEDGTGCFWRASLQIVPQATTIQDPTNPDQNVFGGSNVAIYESGYITEGDCEADLPITLNGVSLLGPTVCGTVWPDPITLDLP